MNLTPAGAGVFSLFFPGLLICAVARHRLLLAVSVGAGLILLTNLVMARVALRRLVIDVKGPETATVDTPISLMIGIEGAASPLECAVGVEHGKRAWIPALAPVQGDVVVGFAERGVYETLLVRVRTSVPFGLTSCVRTVNASLAQPLHVAPVAVPTTVPQPRAMFFGANPDGGGEPVGLRVYVPGDPQRDVHWPTVARTGTMMVRDRRTETMPLEVTVSIAGAFGDHGDAFDIALGRARASVEQLLVSGHVVLLSTVDGPERDLMSDQIRSSAALAVRLARAQPHLQPETQTIAGQHLVVDRDGAWWQDGS